MHLFVFLNLLALSGPDQIFAGCVSLNGRKPDLLIESSQLVSVFEWLLFSAASASVG